MRSRLFGTALVGAAVVVGTATPAYAWHYPSKTVAATIWRTDQITIGDTGCGVTPRYPRKGILISDHHPRNARWAAVNESATRCANGVLLYRSTSAGHSWRFAGSLGSDFGAPGTCSYVDGIPARIVVEFTGLSCRGGRSTPQRVGFSPWF